ncbi:hypothetical protein [Sporichthya sp.]|uniref:hypothetical protein n=1 Tax=Sporichthya sp. TaxID=65475 RepID=UPI0025DBF3E3|nr:hypothetical protein [Sporichthya sp.]
MELTRLIRAQWDRAGAIAAALVGALSLILGYLGVSGTEHVAKQLPYIISGGLTGIFLLGVAGVLWISADLRDEWRELRGARTVLAQQKALLADLVAGGGVGNPVSAPDRMVDPLRPDMVRTAAARHEQLA